ncbi:MAG: DNA gyrase inhibitor YacG [Pseudomonadota bacterium]|jgi:uncharacterized protein|nr:DNA gyrase inhibitor YacG [Pseudomonadota bacterium]
MRTAPCPQCGQPSVLESSNPWRPFCSERCKFVDLDGWFTGRYTIPGPEQTSPDEDEH